MDANSESAYGTDPESGYGIQTFLNPDPGPKVLQLMTNERSAEGTISGTNPDTDPDQQHCIQDFFCVFVSNGIVVF